MALSPTEPMVPTDHPIDLEQTMQEIAACYQSALAALDHSDLDSVGRFMDEVDDLTRSLGDPRPLDAESIQRVTELHSRLMTALTASHSQTQAAIRTSNRGRKALNSYGNRAAITGTRIESVS